MVEGIDKLGQSLLSQQATRRQQRRDDFRANQKRERNQKLFNAALNATNVLLQDRYNDFYETEGARLAKRLTNRLAKQQLLAQEEQNKIDTFNGSELDYHENYFRNLFAQKNNTLKDQIPGFDTFDEPDQTLILEGTDPNAIYDPEKDNATAAGLFKKLAYDKKEARRLMLEGFTTEDGRVIKGLNDLDGITAYDAYKESNPNSRSAGEAILNFFRRSGFDKSGDGNVANLSKLKLDAIKSNDQMLTALIGKRQTGMDFDAAVNSVMKDTSYSPMERLVETPKIIEQTLTSPDGKASITYKVLSKLVMREGKVVPILVPLTNQQIGTDGVTQADVDKSQANASNYLRSTRTELKDVTDPLTNAVSSSVRIDTFNIQTGTYVDNHIIETTPPGTVKVIAFPNPSNLTKEAIASNFAEYQNVAQDMNVEILDKNTPMKYESILAGLGVKDTDSGQLNTIKDNLGIKYALAKKRVDVELAGTQFTDAQKQQIAASVLLIDKYAHSFLQNEIGKNKGGSKIFKDLSQDSIDPGKMLLAIDYAYTTGILADFADGTSPTLDSVDNALKSYVASKRGEDTFKVGPEAAQVYDSGQKELIKNLHRILSDQAGGPRNTILGELGPDDAVVYTTTTTKIPFRDPRGPRLGGRFGDMRNRAISPSLTRDRSLDDPEFTETTTRSPNQLSFLDVLLKDSSKVFDQPFSETVDEAVQKEGKERTQAAIDEKRSITVTPQGIKKMPGSLLRGDIPPSVEGKVTFVSRIFKDNPDETMFMKRLVNQESLFGKAKGTYTVSGKVGRRGSYGVAQVDEVAFNAVKNKLLNPESSISKYIEPFEKATGIDLTTVNYEDLTDDTLSIAFGRMYLMQLTEEPIPSSKEDQAKYWKTYYNTKAGKGTVKEFLDTNKDL